MARTLLALMFLIATAAWPQQQSKTQVPPEEDEAFKEKEYAFNPLQASKELQVGNYYFKRGSYKAAALRFEEATKWNPGFGDAYLRWAETLEKLGEKQKAKEVYGKFLEAEPDHKRAAEVKKKIGAKG